MRTGPQAHFYLETMCALAVPGPYDQMTIYSSTQNPNGNQSAVARALGAMGPAAKAAVPALAKLAKDDRDAGVRKAAGEALKAIGRKS